MTKTKKTIITVALFAATLLCALCATFAATPAKTFADEPVEQETYYNLYDVNQANWPNGSAGDYIKTTIGSEYTEFECIKSFGTNANYILRNSYMYFEKDVTYKISFKIQTDGMADDSAWNVSTRSIVNGGDPVGGPSASGKIAVGEWKTYSATFTPTATTESGINCFDIIFARFYEEQIVRIKDVKVEIPKSAIENRGENLWNKKFKFGNPAHKDIVTVDDESIDPEYGAVVKYTLNADATKNNVNVRTDVSWKANVAYHISFAYKTEKEKDDSFKDAYNIVRFPGDENVIVNNGTCQYSNVAGMTANGGQWKMFNYDFKSTDESTKDASRTDSTFDIFLVGMNPGDAIYIANFYITAKCDECDKEINYNEWAKDYSTCTAKEVCKVCKKVHSSETVNTTATADTATCTEAGEITYTATFTDSKFAEQTKTVDTSAKGHDYKDGKCSVCEAADPDYVAPTTVPLLRPTAPRGKRTRAIKTKKRADAVLL